jgi:4-hydroxythreonine-4-phosphate dehydrogenase
MKKRLRIILTTGDSDGIGLEVTIKALLKIGPQKDATFYYFKKTNNQNSLVKKLDDKFDVISVPNWHDAVHVPVNSNKQVIEIANHQSPALWVETAALACNTKAADAIVTAPLSKTCIKQAGLNDVGHTEILKRMCGVSNAYMSFVGKNFSVILATGHIPISAVSQKLNPRQLRDVVDASRLLLPLIPTSRRKKPIAVLGLNPHAGDSGIIGSEVEFWIRSEIEKISEAVPITGPLPPDSAFQKENWEKFSYYIALYHDQGLIPFKLIHGHDSGVHITLGLPIIRTSVDHGTAKDIFGKNRANANSMIDAMKMALNLVRG